MARFLWTKELKPDGEVVWRYHDSQTNESGLLSDMGGISTDISWPAYLDWKEQHGSAYDDPMTEFMREAKIYPGEYVKDLAIQLIKQQQTFYKRNRFLVSLCKRIPNKKLRSKALDWFWKRSLRSDTPTRWLWLRFKYSMLQHPLHSSGMIPLDKVSYDSLLWGTFTSERDSIRTKFWLWLTLITFRIYTKMPGTFYQKWKREKEDRRKEHEALRRKQFRGRPR